MRVLHALLICLVLMSWSASNSFAQDFHTSLDSLYVASFDKPVAVTDVFTFKNLTAQKFPNKYTVYLGATRIKNLKVTSAQNRDLDYLLSQNQTQQILEVTFSTPTVGKDKESRFTLTYEDVDIAVHEGTVASVTIPRLSKSAHIDSATTALMVPLTFGPPQMVYPNQYSVTTDPAYSRVDFPPNTLLDSGITLMFGDKQIYEINLEYTLENPTITPIETQVTLPPDTIKQRVLIQSLDPKPLALSQDLQGNWLATYTLQAKEQLLVTANLFVTVMRDNQPLAGYHSNSLSIFLKPQLYWEADNTTLEQITSPLDTPFKMYEYVTENVSYDFSQLNNSTLSRLGGLKTLTQTKSGLCLEYADALITLFRANKIPALLHIGYAKTLNPTLQPVGLNSQSLHAWVEFFDQASNSWRLTDPTWGHTTGGFDYFNQFDVNHITFVVQGDDSQTPVAPGLTTNSIKSSSFTVSVADSQPQPHYSVQQTLNTPLSTLLGLSQLYNLTLTNNSNLSLYNTPILIKPNPLNPATVDYLAPLGTKTVPVTLSQLPSGSSPVTITIQNSSATYDNFKSHASATIAATTLTVSVAAAVAVLAYFTWYLLVHRQSRRGAIRR